MKKILFFCALANVAAGICLWRMPGALPILRTADGAWVYPQSSGSDDVHLLAAALMGFAFAAFMQLFPRPVAAAAYTLNLAVLLAACALVSLEAACGRRRVRVIRCRCWRCAWRICPCCFGCGRCAGSLHINLINHY